MNDRNRRFDTIYTGKPNNMRHANSVNSAQIGIENVTPYTRVSVRVNFSLCYSLTLQKRGDSNSNTTT